jgi:RNA polymerase sigma factor (sigma-70 family)
LTEAVPYNDLDLIRRFIEGDENAFTAIYDQTHAAIFQYARRWLVDRQDAQDITAETYCKLLDRRSQFVSMDNIVSFLKVTARNACLNFLKHKKVQTAKEKEIIYEISKEQEPDLDWVKAQEHYLSLIYAEVDKLPEKMKVIFLMAYRGGLKSSEIAERLNIQVRTVTNQKANAIKILKDALAQHPLLIALIAAIESGVVRL